jgi:hypothetical protein
LEAGRRGSGHEVTAAGNDHVKDRKRKEEGRVILGLRAIWIFPSFPIYFILFYVFFYSKQSQIELG